jgi:uncharacterized repeat protein (TIGR04138 family)
MHTSNFDETLDQIVQKDSRYHRDAYGFVREALEYTQKLVQKTERDERKQPSRQHVSGQELLEGIRACALEQFGPMALTLFEEWGVRRCEDFGEIVFNLVESGQLGKTENDSREDFKGGYSFEEAFRKPFQPAARREAASPEPEPNTAEA